MGNKKRLSSSAEGEEVVGKQAKPSTDDKVILEHVKNKLKDKKERESTTEVENDFDDPSNSNISRATLVQPMGRKKLRKAHEKERHKGEVEGDKPKQMDVELKENRAMHKVQESSASVSSGSIVLPEFHIEVFENLASGGARIRKAAAEVLVTELLEFQKT